MTAWLDPGFLQTVSTSVGVLNDPWDMFHSEPSSSVLDKDCFSIDLDLSEALLYDPIPYHMTNNASFTPPAFNHRTGIAFHAAMVPSPVPKIEPVEATSTTAAAHHHHHQLHHHQQQQHHHQPLEITGQCLKHQCHNSIGYRGFCKDHGGARKCRIVGCPKGSQGRNLCIAHGGGKRCKVENCPKSAQSHGLCKGHGGGARCTFANCNKSSQGGGFCRKHGGGKRCDVPKCKNSAQRGNFCAKHGGSKACQADNCARTDRGGGYCELHRHYKVLRLTKKLQDEMAAM
ncbi:hypothetical protein DYB30_010912 [Aphanomyces astaci]|uniref:WRKY19-like zinc finger domain-containing protein n=3 Tax=Aphanomyces astaci TaxID=112090 RepID=A0A397CUA8_APHAT|nr:hypothetical protein DYB30_010912 [Aphanomyces astaci]RHY51698.1 hypothetical protein DYB34_009953 [Aphanomyces astaci]RHY53672.1 hypothetical protein DYB38_005534 [Aphanomyces astaci]